MFRLLKRGVPLEHLSFSKDGTLLKVSSFFRGFGLLPKGGTHVYL